MPKMSGIEVLRAIKRDRLNCTPIVLSGMADEFCREKCLELGAKYVFDKGTEIEAFLHALGGSHKVRRKFPAEKSSAQKRSCCARERAHSGSVRADPAGKLRRKPMD
jgi:CheY-like chemotaxis protein